MNDNFSMPGCRIERITRESPEILDVAAHGTKPGSRCPDCGRASRAVHSRDLQRPADLPSLESRVRVGLVSGKNLRQGACQALACPRFQRHRPPHRAPTLVVRTSTIPANPEQANTLPQVSATFHRHSTIPAVSGTQQGNEAMRSVPNKGTVSFCGMLGTIGIREVPATERGERR